MLIAFKDEVLQLILSAPEVSDDTAIVTGPLSAIASAALTVAGSLSVLNSFGVNLEPVRSSVTSLQACEATDLVRSKELASVDHLRPAMGQK